MRLPHVPLIDPLHPRRVTSVDGRVCVVTGAGSGIGRSLAVELAARGAEVAVSGRTLESVDETAELARAHGGRVHAAELDVTDRAAFADYADEVARHFGKVNHVYNNAGTWKNGSVAESTFEDFEEILATDLWGVVYGTKLFLPHLIASGDGYVVNVSSINGILAQADASHYCSAKFAVRGFTEALRLELAAADLPVRALIVHPGGVDTKIASDALVGGDDEASETEQRLERLYSRFILRLEPDKAASAIVDAVEHGRTRIVVGNDARVIDLAVRAAPSFALTLVSKAHGLLIR